MNRRTLLILLTFLLTSCNALGERVDIWGDASCDGAELRVDGRVALRMQATAIQDTTILATRFIGLWGDEQAGDTVIAAGARICTGTLRLSPGRHKLLVTCAHGGALVDSIVVGKYNEIRVSCARHRIRAFVSE